MAWSKPPPASLTLSSRPSPALTLLATLEPSPTVRIVRLPNLPDGGDIEQWLAAGGTPEELTRLVATAEPISTASRRYGSLETARAQKKTGEDRSCPRSLPSKLVRQCSR